MYFKRVTHFQKKFIFLRWNVAFLIYFLHIFATKPQKIQSDFLMTHEMVNKIWWLITIISYHLGNKDLNCSEATLPYLIPWHASGPLIKLANAMDATSVYL